MNAINELATAKDLNPVEVIRAAVRLYQAEHKGACVVEWPPVMGCPDLSDEHCPPNASVEARRP